VAVDVVHHRLRRGDRDQFIDGMAERDLPLSVFHFDCSGCASSTGATSSGTRDFPDPAGMLAAEGRGLRICVWINPYIAQRSPLFAEGAPPATW
jgi:alpha-D-xyloside xylohydrolase